jgi:hypothetical protein
MVPCLNMQRNTIRVNRNLFFFQTLFQRDSWWEYPKGCSSILSHQFSLDRVHIKEWTFALKFRECDFIELSRIQNIGQVESSWVKWSQVEFKRTFWTIESNFYYIFDISNMQGGSVKLSRVLKKWLRVLNLPWKLKIKNRIVELKKSPYWLKTHLAQQSLKGWH